MITGPPLGKLQPVHRPPGGSGSPQIPTGPGGISLRDYFAAQALAGFMTHQGWVGYIGEPEHRRKLMGGYATDAYAIADAMIEARK